MLVLDKYEQLPRQTPTGAMYELYGTERRSPRPEWGVSNRRLRRMGRGWDGGGRVASYTAYFAACTFVFALFNAGWEQPMESIPTSDSGPLTTAAPTLGLPKLPKIGHTTDTQNAFKFISANYSAIHVSNKISTIFRKLNVN